MKLNSLLIPVTPIKPEMTIDQVGDLLLRNESYNKLLSLPIVKDGVTLGVISRYQLMNVFMKRFGRDLYGKKSIYDLMNSAPLTIDINDTLELSAQHVTQNMSFPITEDFILVDNGEYQGVGVVLDLLRAMESSVERKNKKLSYTLKHLKQSQTQLIQSEKMASLGQMVAGVAHEINTPLGYVKGNVENIKDVLDQIKKFIKSCDQLARIMTGEHDAVNEEELAEMLTSVSSMTNSLQTYSLLEEISDLFDDTLYGIEQISELVMGLKDFSRLDKARVKNININECINSALLISKNTLKHRIDVIKQFSDLPPVKCSPSQINQVFLNLFTNAAQAIKKQGKLLIKTYCENNQINVVVEDNGEGIDKNHLARIFDPFFTTKEIGQGTGMGLSISYKIIRDHGGIIKVASKPGVGTRFIVRLPAVSSIRLAS